MKCTYFLAFILFLFSCFFSSSLFGQKKYLYDSLYQPLPGYSGNATFSYTLNKKKQPVKEGEFIFISVEKDSLKPTEITYYTWEGAYTENTKTDEWQYDRRKHEVNIHEVAYSQLDYTIFTDHQILKGKYEEGLPEGTWRFNKAYFNGANKTKDIANGETNYVKGKVIGETSFLQYKENGEDTLRWVKGEARDGLMEGQWQYAYLLDDSLVYEERFYQNGILRNITKYQKEDTLLRLEFPLSPNLKKGLATTEGGQLMVNRPLSITFNDGYPRQSSFIVSQKEGNEVITILMNQLNKYHPEVVETIGLSLGTNRGYYPLTSDEKKATETWQKLKRNFEKKIKEIERKQLSNFKFHGDTTFQIIANWVELQRNMLTYITPWNNLFYKKEIEFYNRKGLLVNYVDSLLTADTIFITDKRLTVNYPLNPKPENFIEYIIGNFQKRLNTADSLSTLFDIRLKDLLIRDDIISRKLKIEKMKRVSDSLYTNSLGDSSILQPLLDTVQQRFLSKQFSEDYRHFLNSYDNYELQQDLSDSIGFNLVNINEINLLSHQIDKRFHSLDSIFTEYTFDPFTFTQVPRRAKRILYETTIQETTPNIINEAIKAETTLLVRQWLNQLKDLQEQLFFLRNQETKILERKLKRTDSLDEQLELINSF